MSIADDAGLDKPKAEALTDLLISYRAMVDTMREGQKLINAGQKEKFDTIRYHRLEIKVNALWPKLSRAEQRDAVSDLIKSGHMTQTFADLLTTFNGTINMEQPAEPCYKI